MMKQWMIGALMACGVAGVSAATITFDDIAVSSNDGVAISNGYAGLNWDNFWVLDGIDYSPADTGYANGVVSGTNVAYNAFASPASFFSDTSFDLTSAYVTKAWNSGYTRFVGYVGSVQTYLLDVFSTTTSPTLVDFGWSGVTKVTISDLDGTAHTAIDNLVINGAVSAVPVPAAVWLFGTGVLGMVGVNRRTKKAQTGETALA